MGKRGTSLSKPTGFASPICSTVFYVPSSCTVVPRAPRFPFSASAIPSKPIGTFCSSPLTWPSTNHFRAFSCQWRIPPRPPSGCNHAGLSILAAALGPCSLGAFSHPTAASMARFHQASMKTDSPSQRPDLDGQLLPCRIGITLQAALFVAAWQLPHTPSHFGICAHGDWFSFHRRV